MARKQANERPRVDFDHHSPDYAQRSHEIYKELRSGCPMGWTDAHEGFWVASDYESVAHVARDDVTYSSANDLDKGPCRGINIPRASAGITAGMIETDPPRFHKLRQATNPWFSPAAVEKMKPEILEYTTWCIDRFIEGGEGDLTVDLASPVPAMLTIRILGIPLEDWKIYADAMHRGVYTPPNTPERIEVDAQNRFIVERFFEAAAERRGNPRDDLVSFLTNLEVEGELMPLEEVVGNAFLFLAGGVDTTTALMGNTLLHLHSDRQARRWLMEDASRMRQACEEYLRYFTPVQGLSRNVTRPCQVSGVQVEPTERIWMSWASANLDPQVFDDPQEIRLDRFPNRHAAFGLGAHRCLGSNVARSVWSIVIGEVLRRMPDYEIDEASAEKYWSIGVVNGWASLPARFTPGSKIGTSLSL